MQTHPLVVKNLGKQDYQSCFEAMQNVISERIEHKKQYLAQDETNAKQTASTADELWLVEHPSVYTLGQAGKTEHILNANNTPIIKTDRGGQVTWHGEGQLVAYFLFDLFALGWNVRELVTIAEESICELISPYLLDGYYAKPRKDAPGVYVFKTDNDEEIQLGKIASLGFKIKRGFSYHGVAINIATDLSHFSHINPCGHAGMTMLNLVDVCQQPNQINYQALQARFIEIIQTKQSN